uniref:RNA polymerase sigma factor n=1 Tax=uncultured Alphaproteobacteria bacterium TaxID=91750 RepID=A0A6G8F1Y5_9PROT|nr:RNA polymerase sigma factor RpoH [uncultured Alphaproteobacteria bacterium]
MDNKVVFEAEDFSPEINLARYLQNIRRFPILSSEEEYKLASEYVKTRNAKISYILVTSHLRLVVKVVSKFKGYGLPMAEMISEGNIGLLYAVDKFDPEKGFRFSTYALWWIRAAVQKYVLNSWSLVKIGTTAAQKKLFFNLRKMKNRLNLTDDRELSHDVLKNIATTLDVSVQDVTDMNMRLKSHDGSLNVTVDSNSENGSELLDFIADGKPNQEEVFSRGEIMDQRRRQFAKALECLNPREKDILFKRRLSEKAVTLDDLSRHYAISKERVRQIELNSIRKIRNNIMQ